MYTVYLSEGKIVAGLCDRNGIRNQKSFRGQWGGSRVKSEVLSQDIWLEPLAKQVLKDQKEFIKSKYIIGCCGIEQEDNEIE